MVADVVRETVRFRGPHDELGGELAYPYGSVSRACLLLGPHPFMGGRMENHLIACLAESLAEDGAVTLRFDYAGVGRSDGPRIDTVDAMARFWETGSAPQDPSMIEDGRGAMSWLREQSDAPLVLIGYSFGACAAISVMDPDVTGVVLISPTIELHDFSGFGATGTPTLCVYSDNDLGVTRVPLCSPPAFSPHQ